VVHLPVARTPLHLDAASFRRLFVELGPSLGLWRAAEVAALRQHRYEHPIVEAGCGDGLVTSLVLRTVEIGCDPWPEALSRAARRRLYKRLLPVPIEKAGIAEASVATVICNSVVEHIRHLEPVLAAVARMLIPGGRFVFAAPSDRLSQWLILPSGRYSAWRNRRLHHVNLWPVGRWAAQLALHGLKITHIRPYLKRRLVALWDFIDLLEQVWVARRRLVGVAWRRLPGWLLDGITRAAAHIDLSAPFPGGGRLIIAEKGR
jgi:SAM-dependent methyltransferase